MAYGLTAYVAVPLSDALPVLDGIAVRHPDARIDARLPRSGEGAWDYHEDIVDVAAEAVQPALTAAHERLVRAEFDPAASWEQPFAHNPDYRKLRAVTPAGPRFMAAFSLALAGDADEIGDPWPDGFSLGVTIATRYAPTWMDWRDEYGIDQYRHDERLYTLARQAIVAVVPEMADAGLLVRMEHF